MFTEKSLFNDNTIWGQGEDRWKETGPQNLRPICFPVYDTDILTFNSLNIKNAKFSYVQMIMIFQYLFQPILYQYKKKMAEGPSQVGRPYGEILYK